LRAIVTAWLALACGSAAGASDEVPSIALGGVKSRADSDARPITRDGGFSVQYSMQPPQSLWLFGDTSQKDGPPFLGGTTAASGLTLAGQAPLELQELPTPPAALVASLPSPQPFFPAPQGLKAPRSGKACGAADSDSLYPAAWPAGGARLPGSSNLVLVSLQVCVTRKGFPVERLTLSLYDPADNRLLASVTPFVASPLASGLSAREVLVSPVFADDGYLYLFALDAGAVYLARVSAEPSSWGRASNYAWWSQSRSADGGWTHQASSATSLLTGLKVYGVSAGDYSATTLHKYVLLIQTQFHTAGFALFEARSLTGPWKQGPVGRVPDGCSIGVFGCYSLNGHPEMSTQESFVYSWYSPGEREGQGRVNIAALRW
jgi:hypothetical protein